MLTTQRPVRIGLLGPLRFMLGEADIEPPSGRPRELLEILLIDRDRRVGADDIASSIWPDVDVHTGRRRLQLVASRLRRALPPETALEVADGVYALHATTDVDVFHHLADAADGGDADAGRRALDLWTGEAFEAFPDTIAVRHARALLHDRRDQITAAIAAGRASVTRTDRGAERRARTGAHEILRPRLLEVLPDVGRGRLVALVAPGGFGKTTLLRHWSNYSDARVAWIDVTSDHDTAQAVCAAVESAVRTTMTSTATIEPEPPGHDHPTPNVSSIVNDLLVDNRPMAIIFDGVEHMRDHAARHALSDLIRLAPTHVTVALATRQQLPSSIGRPATAAESVILGADDLAFTRDELNDVVDRVGNRGGAQFVDAVYAHTRGWPAPAMYVTTRPSGRAEPSYGRPEHSPDLPDASVDEQILASLPDTFLDEVLRDVAAGDQAWLIATAHLDELDLDLCEAVTGIPSRPVVERIIARHHLVDRIDGRLTPRAALRHLLQRRQELDSSATRRGHARASRWYLAQRRSTESLDHAIASGDRALIPTAAEPALWSAIHIVDLDALRRWTPALGPRLDLSSAATVLVHLASGVFPIDERGRLRTAGRTVPDAAMATSEAVDLWSQGRCRAALERVASARELLDTRGCPASAAVDTVLSVAEGESRVLLEPAVDPSGAGVLLRAATQSGWPWVNLRAYGLLALQAVVGGEEPLTMTLLEQARRHHASTHRSGRGAVGVYASIAQALVDGRGGDAPTLTATIARLRRLADDADRFGWIAVSVAARYAVSELQIRSGDTTAARATIAGADERRTNLSELGLLAALRRRCVDEAPVQQRETADLTERERTVLRYLDSDMTMREIADALFTSLHTVRTHVRSIYRKLGVARRAEAVASRSALCTDGS